MRGCLFVLHPTISRLPYYEAKEHLLKVLLLLRNESSLSAQSEQFNHMHAYVHKCNSANDIIEINRKTEEFRS